MGYDYSNHHVFAGNDPELVHNSVIEVINQISSRQTDDKDEANRSIVVGPSDRWIFVGDSAGSTENAAPVAFDQLSIRLSTIAPTIAVKMSDSAIVHILLYVDGQLADKFGNGKFPWYHFQSTEKAEPFKGVIPKWSSLLNSQSDVDSLRQVWSQQGNANSIVSATAKLFGMNPELMGIGYSIFDEADEIKYDDYLPEDFDFSNFQEFHFIISQADP